MKKKLLIKSSLLLSVFFLFSCTIPYSGGSHVEKKGDINIYYVNDTHGAFNRENSESNYYEAGMSYISTYLRDKKKDQGTVILSGGDMFQGRYESNITKGMIMVDAMNIIGFDAMVLGNHEFDWGEPTLRNIATSLNCPVLSSNTFYSSDSVTMPDYISPYTIIEKGGIKIGIIGGAEKNMGSSITGSISSSFYFPDPVYYVKQYSDKLRLEHKCDLVIGAFHDGEPTNYIDLTYNSEKTGKKYIDGLFLAHDHRAKKGELNGVPYLESSCNGRMIGQMSFTFDAGIIKSFFTSNMYTYENCTRQDSDIEALRVKYQDQIGDPNQVICTLSKDYSREEFTVIAAQSMMWYVNNHLDEFGGERVYFSSHNTGGIRVAVIPKGEMTLSELFTYCPFDNDLCIQKCNRSNISYMAMSSYYRTYQESDIIYDNNGLTTAVTISYIAESEGYSDYCQVSYQKYEGITAKITLLQYLKSGVVL